MDDPTGFPDPPGNRPSWTLPETDRRATFVIGLVLVVVGAAFLVARQLDIDIGGVGWPLFVIVPGVLLFLMSFAIGGVPGSGLAVAGSIVTAVGLILAWQNETGLWATWAYAWALVAPGGAGLGLLAYGLLTRQSEFIAAGRWMALIGAALFAGFGLFFEGVIGLSGGRIVDFDTLLPIVLVVVGGALVLSGLIGRGRRA
jgi:hypothetical protein